MVKKLLTAALATAALTNVNAQSIVGLTTSNQIFTMANASAPSSTSTPVMLTGIVSGQSMVGIDCNPVNGEMYGLGYNAINSEATLYKINTTTAVATAINATPITLSLGVTLGGSVGFDFNPSVDRIRVVGENGKNYRLHPATGAIVATDVDLAFAIGDANFGTTPKIGALAYTESYVGTSTTILYNYDENLNIITRQDANAGLLTTIGVSGITLNALTSSAGMDIYKDPISLSNVAYLSANATGSNDDNLYTVNLTTGAATQLGVIGSGIDVRDIAVVINRNMTSVTGNMIYGIRKGSNTLISFDSDNPRFIRDHIAITGVTAGQVIVGTDFRPATFELYGLGYNEMTGASQLYTINTATGVATAVNSTPVTLNLGAGATNNVGFDFNPVADRIRVVSSNTKVSYRLNPADGSISATDMSLAYVGTDIAAGFAANIGTVAYTNSYKGTSSTTLFAIDDSLGSMVKVDPPNDGKLTTIANLGLTFNLTDRTSDMDFYYDSVSSTNMGYVSINDMTSVNDKLYKVTLTGGATMVNDIGLGVAMSDIAAKPQFRNTLSVSDINETAAAYTLFPNPAVNELYIAIDGYNRANIKATITDITGRVYQSGAVSNNTISIANLPAGVYMLKLNTENENFTPKRFVKQ